MVRPRSRCYPTPDHGTSSTRTCVAAVVSQRAPRNLQLRGPARAQMTRADHSEAYDLTTTDRARRSLGWGRPGPSRAAQAASTEGTVFLRRHSCVNAKIPDRLRDYRGRIEGSSDRERFSDTWSSESTFRASRRTLLARHCPPASLGESASTTVGACRGSVRVNDECHRLRRLSNLATPLDTQVRGPSSKQVQSAVPGGVSRGHSSSEKPPVTRKVKRYLIIRFGELRLRRPPFQRRSGPRSGW